MSAARSALWTLGAPVRVALIGLIRLYRASLGGFLGGQCRFYPSCSVFAEEAIKGHGALKGTLMGAWRVLRCGPFTDGGVDRVPPVRRAGVYEAVIRPIREASS